MKRKKAEPIWVLEGPKPYEVQLEALRRSEGHDRFGYFLEQGLGKTALLLNDWATRMPDINVCIVLCPNTFKHDWARSPSEWGLPATTTVTWGIDGVDRYIYSGSHVRYLVAMNYEAVRGKGGDHLRQLMDEHPTLLVVDESSAIKNHTSKQAKAVLDLAKRAAAVRLLNGTPMTQNVMDLFAQLKCLGELDKVNPFAFKYRYAQLGGYMGKQVIGVRNEEELQSILQRCSFRALKEDWADLPEKITIPVRLEMSKEQTRHYKEMLRDFSTMVDHTEFSAPMVLTQMDKLRQITSGLLIDGDKYRFLVPPEENPKIKALLDLLDGGKTVVIYQYKEMGRLIHEILDRKGLNPAFIRGGMSPEEITEQKRKFNQDSTCRVLCGQISATSRGHTLLGGSGRDRAHKMFFHDFTFSLLDYSQVVDRIHRSEQDRACLYYHPVMSPIDEVQLKALTSKQNLASLVVDAVRSLRVPA